MRARDQAGAVGLVAVVAVLHAWLLYDGYVEDDAYIAFRYAARLVEGHGLTWTAGPPVEGYSDLSWVLLTALGGPRGHLEVARVLGTLGLVAAVVGVGLEPVTLRPSAARALSGGLLLALAGATPAWAMGGLEHTFLAGVVTFTAHAAVRHVVRKDADAPLALGLLVIVVTRIDGFVMAGGLVLGGVVASRAVRPWLAAVWPALLALTAQELFRIEVYDDWAPNTARVKVTGTWSRAIAGLHWTAEGLCAHAVPVLGALAALRTPRDPVVGVAGVAAVVWVVAITLVGGDTFSAWRQLVPALPLLSLLAGQATVALPLGRCRLAVVASALALHLPLANLGARSSRARDETYVWRVDPMADLLVAAFGDRDPLIAVDAAGALPYHTGFRSLDLLGLNDRWIAHHPPPPAARGAIGHDLGDPAYVLRQEPDLLAVNSGLGGSHPRWLAARALVKDPAFTSRYQLLRFAAEDGGGKDVDAWYWIRRDGGPLGIARTPDRLVVPGWFLATPEGEPARLVDGELVGNARGGGGVVPAVQLDAGRWCVAVEPEGPTVGLRRPGDEPVDPVVRLPRKQPVDLVVVGAGPVERLVVSRCRAPARSDEG